MYNCSRIVLVDVTNILNAELGATESYGIENEKTGWTRLSVTTPAQGRLELANTQEGLVASGWVAVETELECHRCLGAFNHSARAKFDAIFKEAPGEDEWPIDARSHIDISPMLEEAVILSLPIKQLCSVDCPGIIST